MLRKVLKWQRKPELQLQGKNSKELMLKEPWHKQKRRKERKRRFNSLRPNWKKREKRPKRLPLLLKRGTKREKQQMPMPLSYNWSMKHRWLRRKRYDFSK
jgi:hypothetical protein